MTTNNCMDCGKLHREDSEFCSAECQRRYASHFEPPEDRRHCYDCGLGYYGNTPNCECDIPF